MYANIQTEYFKTMLQKWSKARYEILIPLSRLSKSAKNYFEKINSDFLILLPV